MFHRLLSDIADVIGDNSGEPVDSVKSDGPYTALIFLKRLPSAGWFPQSAGFTVPAGKRAVVVLLLPTSTNQDNWQHRRIRLQNADGSATIIPDTQFRHFGIPGVTGDPVGELVVPEAAAGVELKLGLWNADNNPRSMGGAVVLKIVNA